MLARTLIERPNPLAVVARGREVLVMEGVTDSLTGQPHRIRQLRRVLQHRNTSRLRGILILHAVLVSYERYA